MCSRGLQSCSCRSYAYFQSLYLNEAVGDEVLVLGPDGGVLDEAGDDDVAEQDVAAVAGALDALAGGALRRDLGRQVLLHARGAVRVAALQARHHLAEELKAR